jgi:hypothetical protein
MSCSSLKVRLRLGGIYHPYHQDLLASCYYAGFLRGFFFNPEGGDDFPPKRRLKFKGFLPVSQKIILFKDCFDILKVQGAHAVA